MLPFMVLVQTWVRQKHISYYSYCKIHHSFVVDSYSSLAQELTNFAGGHLVFTVFTHCATHTFSQRDQKT